MKADVSVDNCYECVSSCDNDKNPQMVLKNLHKDHEISHVHISLEDRVVPGVVEKMRKMRSNLMYEMENELSTALRSTEYSIDILDIRLIFLR